MELRSFLVVGHGHDSRLRAETSALEAARQPDDLFGEWIIKGWHIGVQARTRV
jgi:hypothetical protein